MDNISNRCKYFKNHDDDAYKIFLFYFNFSLSKGISYAPVNIIYQNLQYHDKLLTNFYKTFKLGYLKYMFILYFLDYSVMSSINYIDTL